MDARRIPTTTTGSSQRAPGPAAGFPEERTSTAGPTRSRRPTNAEVRTNQYKPPTTALPDSSAMLVARALARAAPLAVPPRNEAAVHRMRVRRDHTPGHDVGPVGQMPRERDRNSMAVQPRMVGATAVHPVFRDRSPAATRSRSRRARRSGGPPGSEVPAERRPDSVRRLELRMGTRHTGGRDQDHHDAPTAASRRRTTVTSRNLPTALGRPRPGGHRSDA